MSGRLSTISKQGPPLSRVQSQPIGWREGLIASLDQRLWAALLDGLAAISWIICSVLLQPWPSALPGPIKLAIAVTPLLLCEPVSIWLFGHTPGQGLLGLRVRTTDGTPLRLGSLLRRHALKLFLLGFSVLYTPFSRRGQSVHDYVFDTMVVSSRGGDGMHVSIPPEEPFHGRQFLSSVVFCFVASTALGVFLLIIFLIPLMFLAPKAFDGPDGKAAIDAVGSIVTGVLFLRLLNRRAAHVRRESPPPT